MYCIGYQKSGLTTSFIISDILQIRRMFLLKDKITASDYEKKITPYCWEMSSYSCLVIAAMRDHVTPSSLPPSSPVNLIYSLLYQTQHYLHSLQTGDRTIRVGNLNIINTAISFQFVTYTSAQNLAWSFQLPEFNFELTKKFSFFLCWFHFPKSKDVSQF